MTSFLAFDRELLAQLRRAARRADDQLAALSSSDPEAADAFRVVRSARHTLADVWLPAIDRVLACEALDRSRAGNLEPAGWWVVADPLRVPADTTLVGEASALGRLLAGDDDSALPDDPAQLASMVDRLGAIADDPTAAAAFRRHFAGDLDWALLFDRLGLDRLEQVHRSTSDPDAAAIADRIRLLDALIVPLGAMYAGGAHTSHSPWYPTVIQHLDPYSAAVLLGSLDLDPRVAAAAADDVLVRWLDGSDDTRVWADPFMAGDNAADLLFRWLAADAVAAREFVERAATHPDVLFRTAHDDATVEAVLVAGTAPSIAPVGDAGVVLRELIAWAVQHESSLGVASDGGVDHIRAVIAPAVAPWLLQLGPRAAEWGWTPAEGDDALRWVIDDEAAAARLVASIAAWHEQLAAAPLIGADGRIDDVVLHDLASMFAQLQVAFRDEEVADAVAARFWVDVTFLVGQVLVSAVVPGGAGWGIAADLALSGVSPVTQAWMQRNGLPRDPDDAEAAAEARFGSRSADTAVVAVVGVVSRLIADGTLPVHALDGLRLDDLPPGNGGSTCAPQLVDERLHAYVRSLQPQLDAATFNALTSVLYAFGNPLSIAQQC